MKIINLVTPKALAKHELLFNEPAYVHPISLDCLLCLQQYGKNNGKLGFFNAKYFLCSIKPRAIFVKGQTSP
jgi:hypothetical protein